MKFKEQSQQPSILYEINKDNPEFSVLFNTILFNGITVIEKIHEQLIHNEWLENLLIMGDPGVGKTTFFNQLLKYLQIGPYQPKKPFLFETLTYDPYSLAFTEGNESPEEKVKLRKLMNIEIINDFKKIDKRAKKNLIKTGQRTMKLIEMPVKGKLDRGRKLAKFINSPVKDTCPKKNKTFVIALEATSSVYDQASICRSIINREADGYIIEKALFEIGIFIPDFKPDDSQYISRLKQTINAMARPEQIVGVQAEILSEAKKLLLHMYGDNIHNFITLVQSIDYFQAFNELEQVNFQLLLTYTYHLLYSQKNFFYGVGLGYTPNSAVIAFNRKVGASIYDPFGFHV